MSERFHGFGFLFCFMLVDVGSFPSGGAFRCSGEKTGVLFMRARAGFGSICRK
jgi:hypothetical protein